MEALNEKILKALHGSERHAQNMKDSQAHQNFQIQDPYFIFQVPQQHKEPTDLEKSVESMIQSQNNYIQF